MPKEIKKGCKVMVISGRDKGREGVVIDYSKKYRASNRILVSGIGMVTKHIKASNKEPGKIVQQESAIHISNVKLIT